jgi:hypothetical protein
MSINSKKPYCFRKTRFNYDPLLARFHPFYAAKTRDVSKRKNTPPETAECPRLGIERREIERGCFRKGAMVVHLRLSVMIIILLFEQDISTLKTKRNVFVNTSPLSRKSFVRNNHTTVLAAFGQIVDIMKALENTA